MQNFYANSDKFKEDLSETSNNNNDDCLNSNSSSPTKLAAQSKKSILRSHIIESFQNNLQNRLSSNSQHLDKNETSPLHFKELFLSQQEIETDEEAKFGIFYSKNFHDIYREGKKLGEGCLGLVKKAQRREDGKVFAVKIVKTIDTEITYNIKKEFMNIVKLDHPNIVKVYELYINEKEGKIFSVMELVDSGEMFDVIKKHGSYSEEIARKIFKQILCAIQYMHSMGCCHRDLKPNNILCNSDGSEVKITDFNVSKFDNNRKKNCKYGFSLEKIKMWTYTGTIAFSAPEIFQEVEYNEAVDMWSAGVVLYTMLCGYQPFNADYVKDLIELIMANKYEFQADPWDTISSNAKDLIKRCLTTSPKERITPTDALMHPWIANTNANPNILPHIVFENLRKNLTRFSKSKMDSNISLMRSKSGDGDEIHENDNLYDHVEDEEERDEVVEDIGRRAISYADELNRAYFFHFRKNQNNKNIKTVKSESQMIEKINEEEVKRSNDG